MKSRINLITDYKNKLKIDDFPIPDAFRDLIGAWKKMKERHIWPMLSYTEIFNFLMFHSRELGSKDLSDYKNSKAYSYLNQDSFNLCNTIIFQEVNTVSSEKNVENLSK